MAITESHGIPGVASPQAGGRGQPRRCSAMHGRQVALGARFVEMAGWQVPDTFRTPEEELAAAHAGLGLVDLSALTKLRLLGAGVVDHLATRRPDAAVPRPGAVQRLGSGSEA